MASSKSKTKTSESLSEAQKLVDMLEGLDHALRNLSHEDINEAVARDPRCAATIFRIASLVGASRAHHQKGFAEAKQRGEATAKSA